MDHHNPFEYGRELSAAELVDREEELARIGRAIRNRGKLFLIGPRRFGKTSILAAAASRASADGVVVLRFDAEKYETLDLLASAILTAAARALEGPLEKVSRLLGRVASSLRPMVEVDPVTGAISVTVGVSPATSPLPLLTDALDAVEALAAETGREVVVVLDELQQVVVEHGEAAERQLRATVQGHRRVGYLFAGSATRLLTAMTTDPNRPFYRLGEIAFLGPVPAGDFLSFLERSFRASGFSLVPGGCERILERAEHVPYNVQRLAHEAWEAMRAGGVDRLTPAAVDDAVRRIVRREDPAYTQLWTSLTTNQKKTLKAAIAFDGTRLQSAEASRRFVISPASVQVALGALEDRHLLRRDDGRYRLVDPFLAAWLEVSQRP